MKKILITLLALVAIATAARAQTSIEINETNFPDAAFRDFVKQQYDTNRDNTLNASELAAVTKITFQNKSATSLKGIEYFSALTYLNCRSNKLTSLDVSKNTALETIDCTANQLTALDVSKNTALMVLNCGYNKNLASLDVSKNTALTKLNFYQCAITTLDVSKYTALTILDCSYNQLTVLDVSRNTALKELNCEGNKLTTLDVSKNTALKELNCSGNQLTTLDVSKNTALTSLSCSRNQLATLDLSKNTALTVLSCWDNQLTTLDVSAVPVIRSAVLHGTKTENYNYYTYQSALGELRVDKTVNIITGAVTYHTVTFNSNGHGTAPIPSLQVASGETIWHAMGGEENYDKIKIKNDGDWLFWDYSRNSNTRDSQNSFNYNTPITGDITLYAMWYKRPTIKTTSLASGVVGAAYSEKIEINDNEVLLPVKYSIYDGSLPDGLSINSTTGVISGTPTKKQSYVVGIQVNDVGGKGTSKVFYISVSGILSSITIAKAPNKTTYTEGENFKPDGMVIEATYNDGSTAFVTDYTFTPSGALAPSNTSVTISYTEGGVTKTTTQAITVNPAHTHTLVKTNAKSATCTEDGYEAYWTCTGIGSCGKLFSDENGETEIAAPVTIPALGHNPATAVEENLVVPTCETDGTYDKVVYCSRGCGEELDRQTQTIPALGHEWGEPTYTWADDYSTATAKRVCQRDASHEESETVTTTSEVTLEPTYTDPGEITYTAEFTNPAFETQTTTAPIPALEPYGIEISEENFPDAVFRQFIADNFDDGEVPGWLVPEEIDAVTTLNVSKLGISDLTGIEHFTALKELNCHGNELTSLDVSTLTELEMLFCYENELTELDVTMLSKLRGLYCFTNELTELDVTQNPLLQYFYCYNNRLSVLDVSQNPALLVLDCSENLLTMLDVSENEKLKLLACYANAIKDDSMDALIASLPKTFSGEFRVIAPNVDGEHNVCTKAQVEAAKEKGWVSFYWTGTVVGKDYGEWLEYTGSDDTPTGINENSREPITNNRENSWYSLDGKKLNGEPAKKGVYIKNGKKVAK